MIGKSLGHYEILEPLGAGGMGKVYRAKDTKLDRHVAVKILPDNLADDYARLRRFQQEAKLLATLNHPNIAAVYDFDKFDSTWYLAQEYIEGQSLYTLLKFGPLDTRDALDIARQVAAGLEAAHAKGIVHRDLKPSNVMVTADNEAKLLDFGVAKPLDVEPAASSGSGGSAQFSGGTPTPVDLAETPTYTGSQEGGVVMGTAGYMSPDQARGRSVDQRADIWSFGALVYEMLTGMPAFQGDTQLDKLAHIVRGDVDWSALPESVPLRVRRLLRRCLDKDLSRRLQHIGDARIELEDVLDDPDEDAVVESLAAAPGAGRGAGVARLPWAIAAVAVTGAIAALMWGSNRSDLRMPPPVATSITPDTGLQISVRPSRPFAISPDGATLVYVATAVAADGTHPVAHDRQLYRRDMGSFASVPIAGTEGADFPFFSPDSQHVGFFSTNDNKLKRVSLAGGSVTPLIDVQATSGGAAWGPGGTIVFTTLATGSGLLQIADSGAGGVEHLTAVDLEAGDVEHLWPRFLPGGNLLYVAQTTEGSELRALDIAGGATFRLATTDGMGEYMDSGHVAYPDGGQLLVAPFDPDLMQLGPPQTEVADLYVAAVSSGAYYSVARNGTLVYVPGPAAEEHRRLVWVDRDGRAEDAGAEPAAYGWPVVSPDGRQVSVSITEGSRYDIWVVELERGVSRRITNDGLTTLSIWSPQGDQLAFGTRPQGHSDVYYKSASADVNAPSIPLVTGRFSDWPRSWSPDGSMIAYYEINDETQRDIWIASMEGDTQPFLVSEFNERVPMFSPDGKWIAYVSNETGRDEVYVRPFPSSSGSQVISTGGGAEPIWSRDGREIFYRIGDRMMSVVLDLDDPMLRPQPPAELFTDHYAADLFAGNQYYDVAPDGRFLMISSDEDNAPTHFNVVLHWAQSLRTAERSP